ncbi:DUF3017 domain-containing protein [Cellulomonas sp. McL0617]|uniref:DUF3017 domain-containing protein n=1 Tax=Cellulomonas sp. McL0617 TaxID=3415675 RepID=UPI003CE935BA
MVHERTTSGAGLRHAAPTRAQTPPSEPPVPADPIAQEQPADPVTEPATVPVTEPATEPAPISGPVGVGEAPVDPRTIARASLAAGRNASLWWVSAGIAVAVAVALGVGTRTGSAVLAAVVAACGIVRLVTPVPGPVALSVRARWLDVSVLFTLAVGLGLFAAVLPGEWF